MSSNHKDPIIWEALDSKGVRLSTVIAHTYAEALSTAVGMFGSKLYTVVDTGERKPESKCCATCGDEPCGKRK